MSQYAPSSQAPASSPQETATPDQKLAALADYCHYKARRHSIVHPINIKLSPPSVTVDMNPGNEGFDLVRQALPVPVDQHDSRPSDMSNDRSVDNSNNNNSERDSTTTDHHRAQGSALTAETIQPFCNRDAMVYTVLPGLHTSVWDMWKEVYRIWYPCRGRGAIREDGAVTGSAFFAKFALVTDGQDIIAVEQQQQQQQQQQLERVLVKLVEFHERLCGFLKGVIGTEGLKMKNANVREGKGDQEGEVCFKLVETFEDCFVFVQGDEWQREGVIVVWRAYAMLNEEMGKDVGKGLKEGEKQYEALMYGSHENVRLLTRDGSERDWKYARMGLQEAMERIMFAQDPERRVWNVEGNAFWEKWIAKRWKSRHSSK